MCFCRFNFITFMQEWLKMQIGVLQLHLVFKKKKKNWFVLKHEVIDHRAKG